MWNEIISFISNWRNWDILLGCIFQNFIIFYIVNFFEDKKSIKKFFKNKKILMASVMLGLFLFLLNQYTNNFPRVIAYYTLFVIQTKYIFNISNKKSIFYVFTILVFLTISEIIIGLLMFSILKIPNEFAINYILSGVVADIFISGILLVFINLLYNKIIKLSDMSEKINNKFITVLLFIVIIAMLILTNKGSDWILGSQFVIYYLFTLILIYMLFNLVKQIVKNQDIVEKYDTLFEHLISVENLLSEYQEINHERKNDLINLRGLVKKDKQLITFIDCLLKDNVNKKNKWITRIINIPSGGLKALMYDKVSKMISSGVKVDINISDRISNYGFDELSAIKYRNVSRIFAILLDNAYEATILTNNKYVSIEIDFKDNNLILIVSNTFNSDKVEVEKIGKRGFSTKELNRGYGLSIFNDIVRKSRAVTEKREIDGNYYHQYVYIKKTVRK